MAMLLATAAVHKIACGLCLWLRVCKLLPARVV